MFKFDHNEIDLIAIKFKNQCRENHGAEERFDTGTPREK
jgi:hypothetical protein